MVAPDVWDADMGEAAAWIAGDEFESPAEDMIARCRIFGRASRSCTMGLEDLAGVVSGASGPGSVAAEDWRLASAKAAAVFEASSTRNAAGFSPEMACSIDCGEAADNDL